MAEETRENNRQFANSNNLFRTCCQLANIPNSKRQAAKFRDGCGTAINFIKDAKKQLGMR